VHFEVTSGKHYEKAVLQTHLPGVENRVTIGIGYIKIPFQQLKEISFTKTLARYTLMNRQAYTGVETMPADAQTMLFSLSLLY
jgi:hypothetical protein